MGNRWLIVEDCKFNLMINLFWTVDPLNALFRRNEIDIDTTPGGFWFNINCNYPDSVKHGEIIFENNNIRMSTLGEGFLNEIFGF